MKITFLPARARIALAAAAAGLALALGILAAAAPSGAPAAPRHSQLIYETPCCAHH